MARLPYGALPICIYMPLIYATPAFYAYAYYFDAATPALLWLFQRVFRYDMLCRFDCRHAFCATPFSAPIMPQRYIDAVAIAGAQ